MADRLIILLRFSLRPHLYVFTKNDLATRGAVRFEKTKKSEKESEGPAEKKKAVKAEPKIDRLLLDKLLTNPQLAINLKLSKKGGIDVSLESDKR